MHYKKLFRGILILKVISNLLFGFLHFYFKKSLPHEILTHENSLPDTMTLLSSAWAIVCIATIVVDLIGLYLFRPFAKPLYLAILCATLCEAIITQIFSHHVYCSTSIEEAISHVSVTIGGVILALLYWSPVSYHFTPRNTIRRHSSPPPLPQGKTTIQDIPVGSETSESNISVTAIPKSTSTGIQSDEFQKNALEGGNLTEPPPIPQPLPPPSTALATASLVLGILAIIMSLQILGAVLGLIGLGLGATHLAQRRKPVAMAWWGVSLSALGALISISLLFFLAPIYKEAFQEVNKIASPTPMVTKPGSDATLKNFQATTQPGANALSASGQMLKATLLWSKPIFGAQALCVGDWEGDGVSRVLVADGTTLHVLDLSGLETSSIPLPDQFTMIECGRNKTQGARLLGYRNWGTEVAVMDHSGNKLWRVPTNPGDGVDGAHWGDLNGDGNDDLVVGMNGFSGLQAWSGEGKQLWSVKLGDVWNQAILPATKDQPSRVIATSAEGSAQLFDAQGKMIAKLKPCGGAYSQMGACRTPDNSIQIAVMDQLAASDAQRMVVFDERGKILWKTSATKIHSWRKNTFATGDLKGDGSLDWAFINGIQSVDIVTSKGDKVSAIPIATQLSGLAIATLPGKSGVLITLDNGTVSAYSFHP